MGSLRVWAERPIAPTGARRICLQAARTTPTGDRCAPGSGMDIKNDLPRVLRETTPEQLLGSLNDVERRNAPPLLYVCGWVDTLEHKRRVSVVGARKATAEGLNRASRIARLLVGQNITVVSGLAEGIDTAAHETAIAQGGRTVAVLGTPLDQVYPAKNRDLQFRIMEKHLAVSQFPLGSPIQRSNFPRRNRTMALIVDASIIVEASDTSGALSQGWETLRLGRPLFIMKALADDPRLKWPAEMRKYGAQVLSDETLDLLFEAIPQSPREAVDALNF